jgi:uncharacterized tellurite resistance protein B-like protein
MEAIVNDAGGRPRPHTDWSIAMGIFEKVLQEQQQPAAMALTPHQAFVAVIVGSVSIDGKISSEETARINQVFGSTRLFGPPLGEALPPVLAEVMGLIQRHGAEAVVELAARSLPPPLHAAAFALAVDLVLADGQAGPEERKFIDTLQGLLQIDDQDATKVVEVMLMKNSV